MENDRVQIVERLKQSANVLITVNNNPTVDQLAACIGITLLLNKLNKHATAVFSGKVPSTIEFLKPEETLEKNTDSLRDFIIALDKAKADKLRYKVEDTMVKIFITPYKTSISDKDLEFSQGDFNIDAILALGIHEREQIDQAIMAHGRILHDAVVMTVDTKTGSNLGTVNWVEEQASSLCEMLASIADDLQADALDAQISTALLTGIVAETQRFSNEKTTSSTMGISSKLMAAGADQHLVATELEPKPEPQKPVIVVAPAPATPEPEPQPEKAAEEDDGSIVIDHEEEKLPEPQAPELPPVDPNEINIDDQGTLKRTVELAEEAKKAEEEAQKSNIVTDSPALGGTFTAGANPEPVEPSTDPLSAPDQDASSPSSVSDILSHKPLDDIEPNQTLEQIEQKVHEEESYDSVTPPEDKLDDARDAVNNIINDAVADGSMPPEPPVAMGSQPVNLDMGHVSDETAATRSDMPVVAPPAFDQPAVNPSTGEPQYPENLVPNSDGPVDATSSTVDSPTPPPQVPPPLMPPPASPVDNSTNPL